MKTLVYQNGVYHGQVNKNTEKHGFGIFLSDKGQTYLGEWFQNQVEGQGFIILPHKGLLTAQFKANKLHGILNYKSIWQQYQYGQKDGFRIDQIMSFYEKDNLIEENLPAQRETKINEFKESIFKLSELLSKNDATTKFTLGKNFYGFQELGIISNNIQRLFENQFEEFYVGQFENQQLNTYGHIHLKNGDFYLGEFKNGLIHGLGMYWVQIFKKWYMAEFNEGQCQNIILQEDSQTFQEFQELCTQFGYKIHQKYSKVLNETTIIPQINEEDLMLEDGDNSFQIILETEEDQQEEEDNQNIQNQQKKLKLQFEPIQEIDELKEQGQKNKEITFGCENVFFSSSKQKVALRSLSQVSIKMPSVQESIQQAARPSVKFDIEKPKIKKSYQELKYQLEESYQAIKYNEESSQQKNSPLKDTFRSAKKDKSLQQSQINIVDTLPVSDSRQNFYQKGNKKQNNKNNKSNKSESNQISQEQRLDTQTKSNDQQLSDRIKTNQSNQKNNQTKNQRIDIPQEVNNQNSFNAINLKQDDPFYINVSEQLQKLKQNISESIDKNLKTLDMNEYDLDKRIPHHNDKQYIQKQPLKLNVQGPSLDEKPFRASKQTLQQSSIVDQLNSINYQQRVSKTRPSRSPPLIRVNPPISQISFVQPMTQPAQIYVQSPPVYPISVIHQMYRF